MNSNQIYEGEFYAWYQNRGRGVFPTGAAKVKAGKLSRSKPNYYEKNRKTLVEITVIEPGTGTMRYFKEGHKKIVPAREIIDFWDEYKAEEKVILDEREKRSRVAQRETARRQMINSYIESKLRQKGLNVDHGSLSISGTSSYISISLTDLLKWIGVSRGELDEAVDNLLGPDDSDSTPGYSTSATHSRL